MNRKLAFCVVHAALAVLLAGLLAGKLLPQAPAATEEELEELMRDGNYLEAFQGFARRAREGLGAPERIGVDLSRALQCLDKLARQADMDAFREEIVALYAGNWRLLWAAGTSYLAYNHRGTIVAGVFQRGQYGGGEYASSLLRDRARAIQLLFAARAHAPEDAAAYLLGDLMADLASALLFEADHGAAFRLLSLTDLAELPDHERGGFYGRWGDAGAAVDAEGNPIFHRLPASLDEAKTDGERWRFALAEAARLNPARAGEMSWRLAEFLNGQFGVRTIGDEFLLRVPKAEDGAGAGASGPFALESLADEETICRLATGVRRIRLPDEFNFLKIYRSMGENAANPYRVSALQELAQIFEDRRQYPRAAEVWQRLADLHDTKREREPFLMRRNAIIGNWSEFEPVSTQPAQKGATVDFRFRNGRQVSFEARAIKVEKLLEDVQDYLKSDPGTIDGRRVNIEDLGWRLVTRDEKKYLGERVAAWSLDLEPAPGHQDRRITVATPLRSAGAYLLSGRMEDGNTSRTVLWVADTAIVRKHLDGGEWYLVADAVTGSPVEKANVEFFGYCPEHVAGTKRYRVLTKSFARLTDAAGQVVNREDEQPPNHQWLAIARTPAGRLAYLGFSSIWMGRHEPARDAELEAFAITDRPVYRPEQTVHFKCWLGTPRYDREGPSDWAGREIALEILDPRDESVLAEKRCCDEYGGLEGSVGLGPGAALGVYTIQVDDHYAGAFRVEEYKKPEFEVAVEAPAEPIALGERFTAVVKASYYFGGPVREAKVQYRVLRTSFEQEWYPPRCYDWLYGPGYWWFGYDCLGYPGWERWGCSRPVWWWLRRPSAPPEVIAQGEAEIAGDGTFQIDIDSAPAKALYGDQDHRYQISVDVTDRSRRTISGSGAVIAARAPFKVYVWPDRGYYRAGDTIEVSAAARTPAGEPVSGKGVLRLFSVRQEEDGPVETLVEERPFSAGADGPTRLKLVAARPGPYRASATVTDARERALEGACLIAVHGDVAAGTDFRFNALELVPERMEQRPGDKAKLRINTDRAGSTVFLFVRPVNGVYLQPEMLELSGTSREIEIEVRPEDVPNFFVEALSIADGRVHQETRLIAVPPEDRALQVAVLPESATLKPGQEARVTVRVTDHQGKPFAGAAVVTIYDKAVEYISGGSNVPDILACFWAWRRGHHPYSEASLERFGHNVVPEGEASMSTIGAFGDFAAGDLEQLGYAAADGWGAKGPGAGPGGPLAKMERRRAAPENTLTASYDEEEVDPIGGPAGAERSQPAVRTEFADTALWRGALVTDQNGVAEVSLAMPENLTTWKARAWCLGHGLRVGEGSAELVTTKNLLLRMQAPRFFTEKDEVVLSANVHNRLEAEQQARVLLELEGGCLEHLGQAEQSVTIARGGETRVDWRVRVLREGAAIVRMKALAALDSDAVEARFPVHVHGMMKTEAFSGSLRPEESAGTIAFRIPEERRAAASRVELRFSPTLAGALVDALPYLADYPYGCTEQTLNRFLPAVITRKILIDLGLDLAAIEAKRTNLNAQEIGEDRARAAGWKRFEQNPVFDEKTLLDMTQQGLERLAAMQLDDGGFGWFSGWGEHSSPHTTALVVHGLQTAVQCDVAVVPSVLKPGVAWLKAYQDSQMAELRNHESRTHPYKAHADNVDALVYMVLADAGADDPPMRAFLYRDRNELSLYGKALFGLALERLGDAEKLAMILRNIEQFLVEDEENQTAWLRQPEDGWWWWHQSSVEAHAFYLKLLARTAPRGQTAPRLAKYLLNNRKHATYWDSTRDTAFAIEALAEYLQASGELAPDMTVEILLDGEKQKEVRITPADLFTFDNRFELVGDAVSGGEHLLEIRKTGTGPLYYNLYSSFFTLEDFITKTGLELKVERKAYRLVRVDATEKAADARGQAVDQKVEKYRREPLDDLAVLKSGELVEVELTVEAKNDYEYVVFEDVKAAGFEPVSVTSGYIDHPLGVYQELRDRTAGFFVRRLPQGRHSISYRLRAEIPGRFSALPAKAYAMYAPELAGNSDEVRLVIED
ncbi:MAG: alpha-2-macroglobulin [Planctomycetes bacterium]|nr:alpha-2-macroglobulin [Planctomycetota bacterium]